MKLTAAAVCSLFVDVRDNVDVWDREWANAIAGLGVLKKRDHENEMTKQWQCRKMRCSQQ